MRVLALSAILALATAGFAWADANVAGHWRADMGGNVGIEMHVGPDGQWDSRTTQGKQVVRQMSGTYTQTQSNANSGTLVFKPTQASGSGGVQTETDQYALAKNGQELRLTSEGDTMVFHKLRQ